MDVIRHVSLTISIIALGCMAGAAGAAPAAAVGQPAPDFELTDHRGETVKLSDFDGKIRVLEWVNPDCPFVKRHTAAGTMRGLAERYAEEDVVWLAVNSTHYMDAASSAAHHADAKLPYPVLVDRDGRVGHAYGAKTTPHMFVIDAGGTLVYSGAIDDDPRGGKGEAASNHVAAALDDLLAGRPVAVAETQPYGCSVKYKK